MSSKKRSYSNNRAIDDDKRRSSRRTVSPFAPRCLANDNDDTAQLPAPKRMRTSLRNLQYCCDIENLPNEFKCNGCSRWDESRKSKPRSEMVTREYQCHKVWTYDEDDVPERLWKHYSKLVGFIESNLNIDRSALAEESTTTTNENNNVDDGPPPAAAVQETAQQNVNFTFYEFSSQGQDFSFLIPNSHCIEHASDVKRWKNGYKCCERIREKFKKKLYRTKCMFSQALWAIATCTVPALALSAAQFLFPLIVLAFLHDTGIFNEGLPAETFPRSFPSDATL